MMNAAILGCGYVGQVVAQRWRNQGIAVTATTTQPERVPTLAAVADRVVVVQGDDAAGVRSLLQEQQVLLLSLGAKRGTPYRDTYLATAQTVAQVIADCPTLKHLIYTSSAVVYGDRQGTWVDETAAIAPEGENAEILAETEQTLLQLANGDRIISILRLAGIYGPGRELDRIFRTAAGTTRPGDGSNISNWVHLEDIVGAILLVRSQRLGGIFNLVNDTPLPSNVLLSQLFERQQLPPVQWDPNLPKTQRYNVRLSNQKIKTVGYQFTFPSTLS